MASGLTAEQAYGLSQSEIKKVASGFDHAERTGDNTFSIFFIDGSKVDLTIPLPKDGKDAVDIVGVNDLGNGKFTLLLSDGSETSAVQTIKGQDGFSPSAKVEKVGDTATITITDKNGTTTATVSDGSGSEGGEANVIDSISVNGVNVSPDENKNVDITVPSLDGYAKSSELPTKVSDLANDSNYQTADDITATLTPYAKSADVTNEIITEVAKIVADAPEDLNTLKEMSDWIAGHEDDASAMNSAISDNKTAITALQTGKADKSDIPTTLPANGGNADTVNNHTVESDVPTDAVFTDTVYDDTEVKESIAELNSNLVEQKMLGWTVPSECPIQNYTDSDGVFHQRVGRIDLGSLEWTYDTLWKATSGVSTIKNLTVNMYHSVYVPTIANVSDMPTNSVKKADSDTLWINNGSSTEKPSGYLYFELAEEKTIKVDGNEAVTKVNESLSVIGKCKNLLNPTLQTTTQNGVTCTANGDGTYTLNGTASSDIVLELESYKSYTGKEKFRLVGCPNGGGESKYYLAFRPNNAEENRKDIGSGVTFNDLSTSNKYAVAIIVLNGTTVTNLTFKPMLTENLNATFDDFVPYTGDGETLTHDVAKLNENLGDYGLDNKCVEIVQGSIGSTGSDTEDENRVKTKDYLYVPSGSIVTVKTSMLISYTVWNESKTSVIFSSDWLSSDIAYEATQNCYVRIKFKKSDDSNCTPSQVGHVGVYINNAIDKLKNDLSTKIYELAGSELYLCVSGKSCVLTLNGYNLTGSTNFSKLAEYPPYLVVRNVVSKEDGVCIFSVDPDGNIGASDLQVASSVTGKMFGEVSWVANI